MNNLTPYQKEALNFKNHIALTANAGSGKTFVLAKRYIEIALQGSIKLSSIIAITFTEKAASELYKRISDEIDLRLLSESDESTRKRLITVRRHLVSAKISTIHSFCSELLKEFSPEAGIDANFKTIDDIESGEMITESINGFVSKAVEDKSLEDDFKYLVRIFGSIGQY
jgi:ATP-dependent helicase/nuclease subunit A